MRTINMRRRCGVRAGETKGAMGRMIWVRVKIGCTGVAGLLRWRRTIVAWSARREVLPPGGDDDVSGR